MQSCISVAEPKHADQVARARKCNSGCFGKKPLPQKVARWMTPFLSPPAGAGWNTGFWSHGLAPVATSCHPLRGFRKVVRCYMRHPPSLPREIPVCGIWPAFFPQPGHRRYSSCLGVATPPHPYQRVLYASRPERSPTAESASPRGGSAGAQDDSPRLEVGFQLPAFLQVNGLKKLPYLEFSRR